MGKGITKPIKAFSRLEAALDEAAAAEDAGVPVEDTAADDDPMNALDAVDTDGPSPQKKKKPGSMDTTTDHYGKTDAGK